MDDPIEWLLAGEPWVEYRTRLDLLGQNEDESEVKLARQRMLEHELIQSYLAQVTEQPWQTMKNHKKADHPIYKLTFLAEIGLTLGDPGMGRLVEQILVHQSDEGPFEILSNYPTHFGGTGQDMWTWALCDAPALVYSLQKFGLGDDARVRKAVAHMAGLVRKNGWPCAVSPALGKFRGPGKKDDPCPLATLLMLKILAQDERYQDSEAARVGCETLLSLWRESKTRRPFLFRMGTDFYKLKAPFVWYDILHVCEVLSCFESVHEDERFREMHGLVLAKADAEGKFTPESVWKAFDHLDCGQKKEPSRWITFLLLRQVHRINGK